MSALRFIHFTKRTFGIGSAIRVRVEVRVRVRVRVRTGLAPP